MARYELRVATTDLNVAKQVADDVLKELQASPDSFKLGDDASLPFRSDLARNTLTFAYEKAAKQAARKYNVAIKLIEKY